ncbi:MAG: hypothetical protein QM648_07995 [Solirubrobacterales bacterium]
MLDRTRRIIVFTVLFALLVAPATAGAKSVQPRLSSLKSSGAKVSVSGSVKLAAKKTYKGKKLKVVVAVKPASGKTLTKSASIKAKKKAATIKFKASVTVPTSGTFKISAQLYAGKKKLGKASKTKKLSVTVPGGGNPGAAGTAVDVGGATSCAAVGDNLKCWGAGAGGSLGNGSSDNHPTAITSIAGISQGIYQFSVAEGGGCQLFNGSASCWGDNYSGELGSGTDRSGLASSSTPVQVVGITGGGSWIAAGGDHACAINNAKIQCWGNNHFGQLGNGTDTHSSSNEIGSSTPQDVSMPDAMGTPYSVAVGGSVSCANTATGIWCWGQNNAGQLGQGTQDFDAHNKPLHVGGVLAGIANFVNSSLSVGIDHVCAQLGGHPYCWGSNQYGQIGNSTIPTTSGFALTPVSPDGLPIDSVSVISAGNFASCAIALQNLKCWGLNDHGQTGTGTISGSQGFVSAPTQVVGFERGATSVSAGWFHTCGSLGTEVRCWGANGGGTYLGNGQTTDTGTPVAVQGL